MLPALGPSTMRDALAKPVDMLANPIGYITNIRLRNSLTGSKLVDTRANLLEITDRLDESALDKYTMVRDAWAQRRAAQVRDEDGSYDAINADAPRELTPSLTP
jgi:phospholipid-binding lipoprotein MlaA